MGKAPQVEEILDADQHSTMLTPTSLTNLLPHFPKA